jgi:hypothetical protein
MRECVGVDGACVGAQTDPHTQDNEIKTGRINADCGEKRQRNQSIEQLFW